MPEHFANMHTENAKRILVLGNIREFAKLKLNYYRIIYT